MTKIDIPKIGVVNLDWKLNIIIVKSFMWYNSRVHWAIYVYYTRILSTCVYLLEAFEGARRIMLSLMANSFRNMRTAKKRAFSSVCPKKFFYAREGEGEGEAEGGEYEEEEEKANGFQFRMFPRARRMHY